MPPLIRNRQQDAEEEVRSIIEDKVVDETHDQETKQDYRLRIVWRNVVIMGYLHLAALYGIYLCFTAAMFKTVVAGKSINIYVLMVTNS